MFDYAILNPSLGAYQKQKALNSVAAPGILKWGPDKNHIRRLFSVVWSSPTFFKGKLNR